MLTEGAILLICVLYAWKHRGSDAVGIILGVCLGVAGANGIVGTIFHPIIDAIVAVVQAVIDMINGKMHGGGGKTSGLITLRYNLALFGIGR